jgi:hypothetical protein
MSWPEAFAAVGIGCSVAAIIWAFCWMSVRIAQTNNSVIEIMEKSK